MRKKRIFFSVGVLFVLAAGAWFYYLYNKPHRQVVSGIPDLSIRADSLYALYSNNEAEGNEKFLDKIIAVSGTLSEITTDEKNCMILLDAKNEGGGINCQLLLAAGGDQSRLHQGDKVVILGKCTGFNIDVNLAGCAIKDIQRKE